MHDTVIAFYKAHFPKEKQQGKTVLEVGSKNEGGTLKSVFLWPKEYIGLDMQPGTDVDVVSKLEDYAPNRTFDYIISAGTLEHCEDWRGVVNKMKELCTPNGLVAITTVARPFQRHNFPNDYWRFTAPMFAQAFTDSKILVLEQHPNADVFIIAQKGPQTGTADLSVITPDSVD